MELTCAAGPISNIPTESDEMDMMKLAPPVWVPSAQHQEAGTARHCAYPFLQTVALQK